MFVGRGVVAHFERQCRRESAFAELVPYRFHEPGRFVDFSLEA